MSGTNNNVAQAIKMWNDEAPEYNPNSPVASHFTQVVWKDTTELGCAVVACNIASFAGGATSNFYVVSLSDLRLDKLRADSLNHVVRVQSSWKRLPGTKLCRERSALIATSLFSLSLSICCADRPGLTLVVVQLRIHTPCPLCLSSRKISLCCPIEHFSLSGKSLPYRSPSRAELTLSDFGAGEKVR